MQEVNPDPQLVWKNLKKNVLHKVWKENQHLFQWRPHERVLDVGCGAGDVAATLVSSWLPQDYRLILGVDVSDSNVKHAQKFYGSEKITFEYLDITSDISDFLQRKEYSPGFSKIFSFYVFNWLHDIEKGVENVFNLLTTGGETLLFFPVVRLIQNTFKEVRSRDPWKEYSKGSLPKLPPFPRTSDPAKEFKEMLLDTGFEVLKCEVQDIISPFDCDITDMKNLLQSVDPNVDNIPLALRSNYLQECFDVLRNMKEFRMDDSGIFLTQSTLVAVARKPEDAES